MNRISRLFGLLLLSSLLVFIPAGIQAQPCLQLLWSDEFDGTTLDTARWSYEIGMRYNHGKTTTEFWYFDDVMAWPDASGLTSLEAGITELIDVYPNPSSGLFSVDSKDIFPMGSAYELDILDAQGRSVLQQQVRAQGQPVTFDLSAQPTGLYFLRLSGESLHYVKAIQKQD